MGLSIVVACLLLSGWQWDRAHTEPLAVANNGLVDFHKASPLRTYLPKSSIGALTQVSGTWQSSRIVLPNRPADGRLIFNQGAQVGASSDRPTDAKPSWRLGFWIVDLLLLKDQSTIAVVRGWVPNPSLAPPALDQASVIGYLQPSEDSGLANIAKSDQLTTKSVSALAPGAVHDGYLVQRNVAEPYKAVQPIAMSVGHSPLHWRNVVYTLNWIIFAGIVAYMWFRIVGDQVRDGSDEQSTQG